VNVINWDILDVMMKRLKKTGLRLLEKDHNCLAFYHAMSQAQYLDGMD
jgi:hypothetical protein